MYGHGIDQTRSASMTTQARAPEAYGGGQIVPSAEGAAGHTALIWTQGAAMRRLVTVLLSVALASLTLASSASAYIYWGDSPPPTGNWTIARANLDGSSMQRDFISGVGSGEDLAVDGSHIYWIAPGSTGNFSIARANLDGSSMQRNFIANTEVNRGLAVDGSHIYWEDYDQATQTWSIARANLDGSSVQPDLIVVVGGGDEGLAVDGSHIYWHDVVAGTQSIARANLDGSSVQRDFIAIPGVGFGEGLAVDGSHIYWHEYDFPTGTYSIARANLDGSSVQRDFIAVAGQFGGLAVDGSHIYWRQYDNATQTYSIARANLDGSSVQPGFITGVGGGAGMAVDSGGGSPPPPPKTMVALGDSVAAGEGILYGFQWDSTNGKWVQTGPDYPDWMDTTPAIGADFPGCHQSGLGYPNLFALNGDKYQVYNMACTGASGLSNGGLENGGILDREVLGDGTSPPAQLGGACAGCDKPNQVFDKHNPTVVLLTLGADDIGFSNWVKKCYDPTTNPCNSTPNSSLLSSQLTTQRLDLRSVLRELDRRAALTKKQKPLRVLVTNYYNPFDSNNTGCRDYKLGSVRLLQANELSWLKKGLTSLNDNINVEVKYAKTHDAHLDIGLVDISNVMSGHEYCTKKPWVYGPSIDFPVVDGSLTVGDNPAPFHPTAVGQRKIYEAVKNML